MEIDRKGLIEAIKSGNGLTKRALARKLGISGEARRDLRQLLKTLSEQGVIFRDERKAYKLANAPGSALANVMVLEIYKIDEHGDLIAKPHKWPNKWPADNMDTKSPAPDILVKQTRSKKQKPLTLAPGDKILARISNNDNTEMPTARIIKKLGTGRIREIGYVVKSTSGLKIRPAKKGSRYDYLPEKSANIKYGDIIAFELTPRRHRGERIARVIKKLGSTKDKNAASLMSLLEHNIKTGFSEGEIEFAKSLKLAKTDKYRQDLRDLPLITIDPVDAKDFDDAISAMPDDDDNNKGGFIVWVAIADVAAYVKPGSVLDKAAYKRGNSIYLPDRVEPMLPEEISNNLCSLMPNRPRACLAVKMRFNKMGDKISHEFVRGLMRSHARLSYAQAQSAFDGNPDEKARQVLGVLQNIWSAYNLVKKARARRNPLEIEMLERKVRLDENGKVKDIIVKERLDAHKLVEEFMIQANVSAAQGLEKARTPLIYRVHEPPEAEKLQSLSDFLPAIGLKWSMGERATPKRFNHLLALAQKQDLQEVVSMSILRSQMKAFYSPKNKGHFGLNLTHYAHFTSPIRRYADLVVHRALIRAFGLGEDGLSKEEETRLDEISEHISQTERAAMAAERDAIDRYIAQFLSERTGASFKGRISGVTSAGLFIILDETGADGFVPARNLGVERFLFDERSKSLIGAETGGTFKFGRKVEVKLLEVMPLQGGLIFEMLSKPEAGKPPKHLKNRRRSHRPFGGKRKKYKKVRKNKR